MENVEFEYAVIPLRTSISFIARASLMSFTATFKKGGLYLNMQ